MRIYDGDFTVSSILEDILPQAPTRAPALAFDGTSMHESLHPQRKHAMSTPIDLYVLNARLREIPTEEIRRRRTRMNTFYEEVLVSADVDKGIEFNSLLMILAHYKVIEDNKSLRLEEFLRRRARLQRVAEAVQRNVVVGFFDTLYWSRRFRQEIARRKRAREEAMTGGRLQGVPQLDVPEIFVHDETDDENDGRSSRLSGNEDGEGYNSMPPTPIDKEGPAFWDVPITPMADDSLARGRSNSIQVSPNQSPTRRRFQSHSHSPSPSPNTSMVVPENWQFANAILGNNNNNSNGGENAGQGRTSPAPSPRVSAANSPGLTPHMALDPFDWATDGSSDLGLAALGTSISNIGTGSTAYVSPRSRAGTLSAAAAGPIRSRAGTLSVPGPGDASGSAGGSEGARSRAGSNVSLSQRNLVLGELENSAWGESIRRSFTTAGGAGSRASAASARGRSVAPPPMPGQSSKGGRGSPSPSPGPRSGR